MYQEVKNLEIPISTTHRSLTNTPKMTNFTCNPGISLSIPGLYSCIGNTGPYNISIPGYASSGQTDPKKTGQAVMDAMIACCPSSIVTPYGTDDIEPCYSWCSNVDLQHALETSWCLGNYTEARPDSFFAGLGCDTRESGATILGRTGSWGGLVVLGLVVSTAATMM